MVVVVLMVNLFAALWTVNKYISLQCL